MRIYTIGTGKKSAKEFFGLLQKSGVKRVIDVRLNNTTQLAGFTKKADLEYFLQTIAGIQYLHLPELAPTAELLDGYKAKKISWNDYAKRYPLILEQRQPLRHLNSEIFDEACLLCSEPTPDKCHRRLLAEYLSAIIPGTTIIHL